MNPHLPADDMLYDKWVRWLETISDETMTLWLYRDYWRGLVEMNQATPLPPSTFLDALGVWYAAVQAVSVRRQVDRDARSVSLWRLLTDIAAHPEVMTRDRHVALWAHESFAHPANENYDRFAGAGENSISPERTLADRIRLEDAVRPVSRYVDQRVAHTDEAPLAEVPTYDQLNQAVDLIGELLRKYTSLLKAEILAEIAPVHQHDWRAPFRVAWIRPDG